MYWGVPLGQWQALWEMEGPYPSSPLPWVRHSQAWFKVSQRSRGMEPQWLTVESSWKMRLLSHFSSQPAYILCPPCLSAEVCFWNSPTWTSRRDMLL